MAVDDVTGEGDVDLDEGSRLIEQNHRALHALFEGTDTVIVLQSVASFMGCTMMHLVGSDPDNAMRYIQHFASDIMKFGHIAQVMHREHQERGTVDGSQETQG